MISSIDPSHGKIDKGSFSQHTLMELLIQELPDRISICGDHPEDFANWKNLTLNGSGDITGIDWSWASHDGPIDLQWLPPALTHLTILQGGFTGSLNLTALPGGLQMLWASANLFEGEISLVTLPPTLQTLDAADNNLSGSLNLAMLPDSLIVLRLNENRFSGAIDLTKLPPNMKTLALAVNNLSGETDFGHLPLSLQTLTLTWNEGLSGKLICPEDKIFHATETRVQVVNQK